MLRPACLIVFFFFSSRRRHTRLVSDWSSDVCSSDLVTVKEQCNLAVCGPGPLTVTLTNMNAPTLSLGRLGMPAGDDTLTLKGRVTLPAPLTIDPIDHGIHLRVLDADRTTLAHQQIPVGAF